jgi:hypothetical protein
MRQHSCFWFPCASARELQVRDVMGAYYSVEYVENMFGNILCIINEGCVCSQGVVLTPY